ncbi:MAG: AEC family transporter, partial [Campylobacterales bacterium]|nr:AEC family transporter [Campylobacterales bacterium]
PKLSLSMEMIIPVVVFWVVMIVTALTILQLSKIFGFSKEVTGALLLVGVLPNSSFLGIPIVDAYYGQEALGYVIVYDQLGSFLALATYGTFIASLYSQKVEIDRKVIIKKILTFPPFIALIVALFFIGMDFPKTVDSVLESLASTIVPIALVAVGIQLKLKLPKDDIKPFFLALLMKLFFAPFIAFGVCYIFGWDDLAGKVSILEAGMSPMITAGVVASMAGLAPRLSAAIVGYGAIISLFTTGIVYFFTF